MRLPSLGLWLVLAAAAAGAEPGEPAALAEPALCLEEMRARGGDPVAALRAAEAERWHAARRAGRRHRAVLRRHLAAAPGSAPDLVAGVERENEAFFRSVREARLLCGCRLQRGDAHPRDCERRYPSR